jgi:hypothetical protein
MMHCAQNVSTKSNLSVKIAGTTTCSTNCASCRHEGVEQQAFNEGHCGVTHLQKENKRACVKRHDTHNMQAMLNKANEQALKNSNNQTQNLYKG